MDRFSQGVRKSFTGAEAAGNVCLPLASLRPPALGILPEIVENVGKGFVTVHSAAAAAALQMPGQHLRFGIRDQRHALRPCLQSNQRQRFMAGQQQERVGAGQHIPLGGFIDEAQIAGPRLGRDRQGTLPHERKGETTGVFLVVAPGKLAQRVHPLLGNVPAAVDQIAPASPDQLPSAVAVSCGGRVNHSADTRSPGMIEPEFRLCEALLLRAVIEDVPDALVDLAEGPQPGERLIVKAGQENCLFRELAGHVHRQAE